MALTVPELRHGLVAQDKANLGRACLGPAPVTERRSLPNPIGREKNREHTQKYCPDFQEFNSRR